MEISAVHAKYINSTGTHYISNSGSDENGSYAGGQAGDQTGKEWRMRDWYDRPWKCVLRYPDQKVALKIAQLAIDAALNDRIGYDQSQNRTYLTKYYRVRKSWADKTSQIGAFTVFENAKNCVNANPGYAAFDDDGKQVYPALS